MHILADVNLIAWGFLGAACLVSIVLIAKARHYFAPPRPEEPKPKGNEPLFDGLNIRVGRPGAPASAMEASAAEMRRLAAQLQEKIESLEQLVRDSEVAAVRLEQAIAAARQSSASPASHATLGAAPSHRATVTPAAPSPVQPSPAAKAFVNEDAVGMRLLKDRTIATRVVAPPAASPAASPAVEPATGEPRVSNQAEALRSVHPAHSPAVVPPPHGPAMSSAREQRYNEIYLLADYGHSLPEIAGRLAVPVGEVELILSLRDKR
jgi:hypothetical protein